MILSRHEILKVINSGDLVISPFTQNHVGAASIDLTLGEDAWVSENKTPVNLSRVPDFTSKTRHVKLDSKFAIQPGEFVLALTKEKITMPNFLCGWLTGRSSLARFGFAVHSTANFVQPGSSTFQVLELSNLSKRPLEIKAGLRACQLVLEEMKGHASYSGKHEVKGF